MFLTGGSQKYEKARLTMKVTTHIRLSNITLARESHMAKFNIKGLRVYTYSMEVGHGENNNLLNKDVISQDIKAVNEGYHPAQFT